MRMLLPVTALTFAVLLLSGCLPRQSNVTPVPLPSSTPVFATDEAALAAAEAAYREYLAVSDAITADGGAQPERIKPLVSPEQLQVELDGFNIYSSRGWHTDGKSAFTTIALQNYSDNGNRSATISFYVCSDISRLRILDANGTDVTPQDTPRRQTLEVVLAANGAGPTRLRLESTGIWDSASRC